MTSLIFGSIWLGHKGIVNHRREKQRQKNYERWEGLRDEYDEQRKISRESRSLDIQRTGSEAVDYDRPILTLRDQQEANDARTSWRPQESFEDPRTLLDSNRRASVEVTSGSGLRPLSNTKTGTTWDDGIPQPLRVARRNWDDYQPSSLSRSSSLRHQSDNNTPAERSTSNTPPVAQKTSPRPDAPSPSSPLAHPHSNRTVSLPAEAMPHQSVQPAQYQTPGGRMAELIELGTPQHHTPYPATHAQSYAGYPSNAYPATAPAPASVPVPQPTDGSMQEWWNRP